MMKVQYVQKNIISPSIVMASIAGCFGRSCLLTSGSFCTNKLSSNFDYSLGARRRTAAAVLGTSHYNRVQPPATSILVLRCTFNYPESNAPHESLPDCGTPLVQLPAPKTLSYITGDSVQQRENTAFEKTLAPVPQGIHVIHSGLETRYCFSLLQHPHERNIYCLCLQMSKTRFKNKLENIRRYYFVNEQKYTVKQVKIYEGFLQP